MANIGARSAWAAAGRENAFDLRLWLERAEPAFPGCGTSGVRGWRKLLPGTELQGPSGTRT
jgi:hypothetical protein